MNAFTKSKKIRFSAIIILILVVFGVSYGFFQFFKQAPDLSKVKPDYTLNSTELFSAFEKDEKAAGQKYIKKVLEVSGNVAAIEYGASDSTLSITLRPGDELSGVICTFAGIKDQSQLNVKEGENAVIRGECSGMLMDVLLNNCVLLDKRD
jgi:hypothetical protein